jgi:3,4-dihydroxy 2-butanone 4-phosphate synthase/GTP cyclohydrolase II
MMQTHPIYGTTLYIGEFPIDTIYGTFRAITYQDLINKGYIIALIFGSFDNVECIYTRIHSSCVTSETIGSMDCDCVQQMEGALKKISEKENGIFFYLIQEGRGCGYVGKSRACMLVQYEEEKKTGLDTFGAYQQLGMQLDYRDYRNVKDICHLLNIEERNFVLLTNNPDKIRFELTKESF